MGGFGQLSRQPRSSTVSSPHEPRTTSSNRCLSRRLPQAPCERRPRGRVANRRLRAGSSSPAGGVAGATTRSPRGAGIVSWKQGRPPECLRFDDARNFVIRPKSPSRASLPARERSDHPEMSGEESRIARCSACEHHNPFGSRFCLECGTPLGPRCPRCGAELPPAARFCNSCGAWALAAGPRSYTPRYLAEEILTSRGALEGERKQITVLFADMKGSMELIAHRDPEEASNILDPVLEQMMEAVHHYEGIVSEARGDGIMALFGAPLAHEDHAVRACFAALRMQESVRRVARTIRNSQGIEVQIRVGLNSGEVVVRSIGSDLRMDYSAIGETTHLAARMEQLAAPGTVRLTAETARLAEGAVAVKPLGRVAVKGLSEPVEIYEAIGPGPARTRFQAAASRGFTRFVGRDAEMAQLRGSLEQAGEGRGRIVAVVGEPGVGKSRLLHELTHPHAAESWLVLECGAVSYGEATSYLPVIDLLRAYFHIA